MSLISSLKVNSDSTHQDFILFNGSFFYNSKASLLVQNVERKFFEM